MVRTREESAPSSQVACNLPHPITIRILGDSRDLDLAGLQPHGNENVEGGQASRSPYFCDGEVDAIDSLRLEECLPSGRWLPHWSWLDAVFFEDAPNSGIGNLVAEICQCPLNAVVAPGWIICKRR